MNEVTAAVELGYLAAIKRRIASERESIESCIRSDEQALADHLSDRMDAFYEHRIESYKRTLRSLDYIEGN